ncbi:hypothetical protein L3V79_01810 [Thiotrichales bacterium 19S9-12]|nr:hypothetical protein [Thiotrichales bacterium 19S9-12]
MILSLVLTITLMLLVITSLLTWGLIRYDKELSNYLSEKLDTEIKLDLTDVSWDGINPVFKFKTIDVSLGSSEFSSRLNGLSVKISPWQSLTSWKIASSQVTVDYLEVNLKVKPSLPDKKNAHLSTIPISTNIIAAIEEADYHLGILLDYLEDVKPELKISHLKLNLYGANNKQIALMGTAAIAKLTKESYRLKADLITALKKSHLLLNVDISRINHLARVDGYFQVKIKDLNKAVQFLNLDMLAIYGRQVITDGYIHFQPHQQSHLDARVYANDLVIKNHNLNTQLNLNQASVRLGLNYNKDGELSLNIKPDKLVINNKEPLLKQIFIHYQPSIDLSWKVKLKQLQLHVLVDIQKILPNNLIPYSVRTYVSPEKLNGVVNMLEIKYGGLTGLKPLFSLTAKFLDINYLNDKHGINLENASGSLIMNSANGSLDINANSLQVKQSFLGMKNLPKASVKIRGEWRFNHDLLSLNVKSLLLKGQWFSLTTQGDIFWNINNPLPSVNLISELKANQIKQPQVRSFLPKEVIIPKLYDWLYYSIDGADSVKAKLVLKGNLEKFPFEDESGIFDLKATAFNARLSPWYDWPMIKVAKGSLAFKNEMFKVSALQAKTRNVDILPSTLMIKDIRPKVVSDMLVKINMKSDAQAAKDYIQNSPVVNETADWFKLMNYNGDIISQVTLKLPLGNQDPMTVDGYVKLLNGLLEFKFLPFWTIYGYHTQGEVWFNEKKTTGLSLDGWLGLNAPFSFKFNYITDDQFTIDADTTISSKIYMPKKIQSKIKGQSKIHLVASGNKNSGKVKIFSDLKGVSFNFPEPLVKLNKEFGQPLTLNANWLINKDKISLFKFNTSLKDQFDISSNLGVDPKFLSLSGNIKAINLDQWFNLLNVNNDAFDQFFVDRLLTVPVDQKQSLEFIFIKSIPYASSQLLTWLIKEYTPKINISFDQVSFLSQGFNKLNISTISKDNRWLLDLSSPNQIDASLEVILNKISPWKLNVGLLSLRKFDLNHSLSNFSDNIVGVPFWLPSAVISIKQLMYQSKLLINEAKITIDHKDHQIKIPTYYIKGPDIFVLGNANWNENNNKVELNGSATSDSWGRFFASLELYNMVDQGQGLFSYQLSWFGGLTPQPNTLDGQFMFGISIGSFPSIKPGVAKLVGVFSLEAMIDRIGSGINDLDSKGLYFNQIYGNYEIKRGIAKATKPVIVDSPSFDLKVSGKIDFSQKLIDQTITIQPHLSGTMAMAAGLIGGPVAGLATYIVDKLAMASILKNQGIAKVRVSGAWDGPEVEIN